MKKQRLYLVSLCAVLGLSLASCGDDNNDGGGCDPANASKVCGDPSVFYCDAVSKSCKRFLPEHCINKKTDSGSETDVDCGGACVSDAFHSDARNLDYRQRCNVGQTCKRSDDCKSGICEGNVCKVKGCETKADCNADETCDNNMCASCSDGMQNQDETDVDCGGLCAGNATPSRCALGKKCKAATDCESGSCEGNVCVASSFEVADPAKLVINEIQDYSKSTPNFLLNNDVTACEFVEIANSDPAKGFKLDGIKLVIERKDKAGDPEEIDLTGNVIQPKSLVVVHNCDTLPLPEKVVGVKSDILSLVGSGTYDFKMTLGEKAGSTVTLKLSQYASSYNRETDFDGSANMNKTTAIGKNAAAATPGYCINGGLYHENCVTHCSNNVKDEDETGIDCGGLLCEKCEDEGECKVWSDCLFGYCFFDPEKFVPDENGVQHPPEFGVCMPCKSNDNCKQTNAYCQKEFPDDPEALGYCKVKETCNDNQLNQDETDVDCGGTCGASCSVGKVCGSANDCRSQVCEDGICSGTDPSFVDITKIVINEVYDKVTGSAPFPLNRNSGPCEFIEIANISDENMTLDGLTLIINQINEVKNPKKIELKGSLFAKHILVVHSCKAGELDLPLEANENRQGSTFLSEKNIYNIYITDKENHTTQAVDFDAQAKNASSSINRSVDFDPTSPMINTIKMADHKAFATPGYCANGGLLTLNCQDHCGDTILNGNESAVDCGGNCQPCELGLLCKVGSDCISGVCESNVCSRCTSNSQCASNHCDLENGLCVKDPSCTDKTQNGNETDVDCGGDSCGVCASGKKCKAASDCETDECTGGVCTGVKPDSADVTKLLINEVMGSPKSSDSFAIQSETAQSEFVEILNLDSKTVSVNDLKLMLLKEGAETPSTVSLSGSIPAKGVLVVSEKAIPMPTDGVNVTATLGMSNKVSYTLWLENEAGNKSSSVLRAPLATGNGKSQNRNPDMDASNEELAWHDTVSSSGLFNSPGYCANGGTFSSGCKVDCGNHGESCGGICSPCENGKQCSSGADCASGQCEGGECSGEVLENAPLSSLVINEVMGSPSGNFDIPAGEAQCEFVEVINKESKSFVLDGITLNIAKGTEKKETPEKKASLAGIIPAKGVVVVNNCKTALTLPPDAISSVLPGSAITNGEANYTFWLSNTTDSGASVTIGNQTSGASENRESDGDDNAKMVLHSNVSSLDYKASPGYCVNGKLFSNNCQ